MSDIQEKLMSLDGAWWYENIPSHSVYFLFEDNEIVYIGKSINPKNRMVNHNKKEKKSWCNAVIIPVEEDYIDDIEGALIRHFKPKLNKTEGLRSTICDDDERVVNVFLNDRCFGVLFRRVAA